MIWYQIRLALSLLVLLIIYLRLDLIFDGNFENNLIHTSEDIRDLNSTAISLCTDFYHIYINCDNSATQGQICANLSDTDCNTFLFDTVSSNLFKLIKKCNLMTLLNQVRPYDEIYVSIVYVCLLNLNEISVFSTKMIHPIYYKN